jgi:UPF0716 protein FxsA
VPILLLLIFWAAAELFVAIEVASVIGVPATALLLIAAWPVGAWALRSQGRAMWRRFSEAVASGRPPGREAADGALVLIGGLAMLIPGFITDVLGALMLLPPSRALTRRLLVGHLHSRVVVRATSFGRGPVSYDADSTAIDLDQPRLRS